MSVSTRDFVLCDSSQPQVSMAKTVNGGVQSSAPVLAIAIVYLDTANARRECSVQPVISRVLQEHGDRTVSTCATVPAIQWPDAMLRL